MDSAASDNKLTGTIELEHSQRGLTIRTGNGSFAQHPLQINDAFEPLPVELNQSLARRPFERLIMRSEMALDEGQSIAALRQARMLLAYSPRSHIEITGASIPSEMLPQAATELGLIQRGNSGTITLGLNENPSLQHGLVSVLIAAYNPRYLRKALDSVAKQTYRSIEIIVCDDHRGDAVTRVLDAFAASEIGRSMSIRYEHNPEVLGVRKNYERAFSLALGEYCKFLNDDDTLEPTCIERLASALDTHPQASFATSHRRRIDAHDCPLHDQPATQPITQQDIVIDGLSLVNALLMLGLNFVGEPSTVLFRHAHGGVGDEKLIRFAQRMGQGIADLTMWCKLSLRGDCAFIADRLSCFRIHPEQQTQATNVSHKAQIGIPELRERWIKWRLHESIPPNLLRTIPLLTASPGNWQHLPFALFVPPGATPEAMLREWRAKRNPFFTAQRQQPSPSG